MPSCCTDRSSAARSTRSDSAASGRAIRRAFQSRGESGWSTCCRGSSPSLAAIIYVAHLGQARSDAGNGYELDAITAVVLGGTSVFGGRGTLWGTLLGLFSLAILRNGLRLAALPSELAGVLTGALLLATIAIDVYSRRASGTSRSHAGRLSATHGDFEVKNSQVAVLCATIIAAALIVASTNVWLVRSVVPATAAPRVRPPRLPGRQRRRQVRGRVIAMMPKAKGDPYFVSCRAGAEEAAQELGVELIWDGPTGLDAAKQNEVVENWITRKVDVIAVAVENRAGISTVLRKARERGIKVLTWDADAEPDARDFFVNQATPEGIGNTLTDEAARLLGRQGRVRDHHRRAERGQPERVDLVHREARRRETSRARSWRRSGRATTTATRRLPRRRRSCACIRT